MLSVALRFALKMLQGMLVSPGARMSWRSACVILPLLWSSARMSVNCCFVRLALMVPEEACLLIL